MPISVCRGDSFKSDLLSDARPIVIPILPSRVVRFVDPFSSSDEEAEQSSEDDDRQGFLYKHQVDSSSAHTHRKHRSRPKSDHSSRPSIEISLGDLLRRLDRMGYEPTSPSNSPPRSSRSSFSSTSSTNPSSSSSVLSLSSGPSGSPSTSYPPTILHSPYLPGPLPVTGSDDPSTFGPSHTAPRARSTSPMSVASVDPISSHVVPATSFPQETTSSTVLHPNKNRPKARSMSISILPVLHEHVDERPDSRSFTLLTSGGRPIDRNSSDRDDWQTDRKRKRRCSAEGRLEVLKEEREEAL
ncbi:hypothetical protein [Phaffia rhodozyma]|uniref:Uncharacterized protein n=1 Tax=Phaffia rhodozyma TaxID=264483 RepID=A0A0F7SPT7_PHARH|nr:hypothetical protein [Phaffia rhodozyma]